MNVPTDFHHDEGRYRIKESHHHSRLDIVIHAKHILGIILCFNLFQTLVVRAVCCGNSLIFVLSHEVYIRS